MSADLNARILKLGRLFSVGSVQLLGYKLARRDEFLLKYFNTRAERARVKQPLAIYCDICMARGPDVADEALVKLVTTVADVVAQRKP